MADVVSLHVAQTLVDNAAYFRETNLPYTDGGGDTDANAFAAGTYDTIVDINTAVGTDTVFNTPALSASGYITVVKAATWKPKFQFAADSDDGKALGWELLGFDPTDTYSLAFSHAATMHPRFTVWFSAFNQIGQVGQRAIVHQSVGTRGHVRQVVLGNTLGLGLYHGTVTLDQETAIEEWYSLAVRGAKVTVMVGGTATAEVTLDDESLKGVGSIITRKNRKMQLYELKLALREYV